MAPAILSYAVDVIERSVPTDSAITDAAYDPHAVMSAAFLARGWRVEVDAPSLVETPTVYLPHKYIFVAPGEEKDKGDKRDTFVFTTGRRGDSRFFTVPDLVRQCEHLVTNAVYFDALDDLRAHVKSLAFWSLCPWTMEAAINAYLFPDLVLQEDDDDGGLYEDFDAAVLLINEEEDDARGADDESADIDPGPAGDMCTIAVVREPQVIATIAAAASF